MKNLGYLFSFHETIIIHILCAADEFQSHSTIQSLDYEREQDLHYTMIMSLSKKGVEKMKQIIFEAITRTDHLLKETGDETVYSFCMDWFKI